jgi:hypothetical protein
MAKEYIWKNIRKNEERMPDDDQTGRIPRIQLEIIVPPNDEEVTIWFPKDKRTFMPKTGNVIYVMNEDLAKKIDKEIADKVKPPKPRRVKPRRKTERIL